MADMKYTEQHEWVLVDGAKATMGITPYAAEQLGDIVYVEVPEIGKQIAQGDEIAVVESVKAASEVYTPIGGTVTAVNAALEAAPQTVNDDAAGAGWFAKLEGVNASDLDKLMNEAAYKDYVGSLK